ncbi:MAG: hypothetical protein AB8B69_24250 [Chitinophagales bacterium]
MFKSNERFSNSISKLQEAAKGEIQAFVIEEKEQVILAFLEFPSAVGNPYQIVLVENEESMMRFCFRVWDKKYDLIRWKNGIYNLDRLRIVVKEHLLSQEEMQRLKTYFAHLKTQELPNILENDAFIRLDGSDFELKIQTEEMGVHYKWGIATEDIQLFAPLIEMASKPFGEFID